MSFLSVGIGFVLVATWSAVLQAKGVKHPGLWLVPLAVGLGASAAVLLGGVGLLSAAPPPPVTAASVAAARAVMDRTTVSTGLWLGLAVDVAGLLAMAGVSALVRDQLGSDGTDDSDND